MKPNINLETKLYEKSLNNINCRFIKITAKNIKTCPDWHQGKGGKAWLFIDEICVT